MSRSTKAGSQSATGHEADSHDLIRVHGARVNNLRDVDVELPKRRLTRVHGRLRLGEELAGLRHDRRRVATPHQRDLQRVRPGLHAEPGAPGRRRARRAHDGDHRRPAADSGADPRSTVGTATDANAMLRILFSRLGTPHIGPPQAFSFNVAVDLRRRRRQHRRGRSHDQGAPQLQHHRRHVPALRGSRLGQRHRPHPALRRHQVAPRGRAHHPRLQHGRVVRPDLRRLRLLRRRQADPEVHQEGARRASSTRSRRRSRSTASTSPTRGSIPKLQKSMLSKDVDALQPHIRAFVERAVTFTTCPDCAGTRLAETARSSKIRRLNIADACAMQISDLADVGAAGSTTRRWRRCSRSLRGTLDSFVEIGLGYLSLERPTGTLSGGEAQRTKMIRHLGSSLTDVTYVFDEPTVGLHPHDIERMNSLLLRLRDKGNTVLVVEHKPEVIDDRRPCRRPRSGRGLRRRNRRLRGRRRRPARQRHHYRPAPRRPRPREASGARADRLARRCAEPRRTTCATSTSTSRWACSSS